MNVSERDPSILKRHQKVVAARDLPGVPAGTPGVVLLVSGIRWIRYRVAFANGVERGSLHRSDLATPEEWRDRLRHLGDRAETSRDRRRDGSAAAA